MKFMFDMQKDTISNSFLLSLTSDKKGRAAGPGTAERKRTAALGTAGCADPSSA